MQTEPTAGIRIFASYAPQDQTFQKELKEHLRPLQRAGLIELWPDRDMSAGTAWEQESSDHLHAAQIILLLVSLDFMNSEYCYGVEMKRALERHQRREARVIPIILRPCLWEQSPLGKLQVLPQANKPVTLWPDRENVWRDVVQMLSRVVDETLQQSERA